MKEGNDRDERQRPKNGQTTIGDSAARVVAALRGETRDTVADRDGAGAGAGAAHGAEGMGSGQEDIRSGRSGEPDHAGKTMAKERLAKKTYDLDNSPDEIENRIMLATMAARRLERMAANPLPTPTAGSQPHTYPGVAGLVTAHTLMAVAGHDAEMRLWASDIEWGARSEGGPLPAHILLKVGLWKSCVA
jgi:hypothetical protein